MRRPRRTRSVRSRERSDRRKQWLPPRTMKPMDKKLQALLQLKSNVHLIRQIKLPETRLRKARLPPARIISKRISSRPPHPQMPLNPATESSLVKRKTRAMKLKRWSTRRKSLLQSRLAMLPLRRLQASQSQSITRAPSHRQLLKNPRQSPPPRNANRPSPSEIRTTLKSQPSPHPEQMPVKIRRKPNKICSRLSP